MASIAGRSLGAAAVNFNLGICRERGTDQSSRIDTAPCKRMLGRLCRGEDSPEGFPRIATATE